MPQRWIEPDVVESCVRALMPYEDEIKSERHQKMARENRVRDVNTVIATLLRRGWKFLPPVSEAA